MNFQSSIDNYQSTITNLVVLFSFLVFFASCERSEPEIVNAEKQNFIVYNEKITLLPVHVNDGFIVLTSKENKQLINKIDFEGNRIWQQDITSAFDFTTKLRILNTKMFKTEDNGFLIVLAHQDSEKYGNLRIYVKYLKLDNDGNIICNFDKIIIDDNPGNGDNSYSHLDTYKNSNGEIVSIFQKNEKNELTGELTGKLQLSKYTTLGELVSNKEVLFPKVYEFGEILSFSDNLIYVALESYIGINEEGPPTIYQFTENGDIQKLAEFNIYGVPIYSVQYNDNFILCFAGYTTQGNQLIEINKQGNIIRQISINNANKQFLSYSSEIVNENIYFIGITTNNVFEITKPQMTWAKLNATEFQFLGELKSVEETTGFALNVNTDESLSILGQKKSFGAYNMILLKTKTDGTIITD